MMDKIGSQYTVEHTVCGFTKDNFFHQEQFKIKCGIFFFSEGSRLTESSVAFHLSVYGKVAEGGICKHFFWGS